MNYREIYDIAVPIHKRKEERWNLLANNIGRPLSVLLTVPFTKINITPVAITKLSIISLVIGALLVSINISFTITLLGWFFFFVWNILDGVDGNLARCTNRCSNIGDLWDTTGGYAAMVLTYFSAGIAAFYDDNLFPFCESYVLIIMGGAASIMSIFPRLVMHKKRNYGINTSDINRLTDKSNFGIKQIISMNLISPSGFIQIIFLLAIIFHLLNIFIAVYTIVNLVIMIISLKGLLSGH